ncbi:hypothetical protein E2C01_068868 [Portunus trituberculatus]|uniref:Uncharacterized protein n=1 Tax=Portunus trituberculatus TaxID=210409 RepID=A0A5B7I0P4_PORTR|nr:hypothetical protein [Portunus trituberculatus]
MYDNVEEISHNQGNPIRTISTTLTQLSEKTVEVRYNFDNFLKEFLQRAWAAEEATEKNSEGKHVEERKSYVE